MTNKFAAFPSIPRLIRDCVITEKIDGTNAQVCITPDGDVLAGSRSRWITPADDNMGFARWVEDHKEELRSLGIGNHYGEWWGASIQRRYGLREKRFSLFNVGRWGAGGKDESFKPSCCHVVPVISRCVFSTLAVTAALDHLATKGSVASPGFTSPEGVVIYHVASGNLFKATIGDDGHKGAKWLVR